MYAPILEIDTRKIEENARKLHTFCALRGVELAFDGVHFTQRGHLAFAQGMDRALQALDL